MTRAGTIARRLARRPLPVLSFLSRALAVRRERQALRDLPPEMLRDIGLSREAALREAERPIWDVPPHWRR
ncbi:MAG: DUF1127 domain-containing protein [Rhodobacteraceae bacterium]|nr:DUF1127 domain-containing protein [Paracoccaceae bacterium]